MYSVGVYARLSVDAEERKKESIETQIEIAKAFIAQQEDMVLSGCYADIGKSGTNFKRDGFERMMQDVRMHKIDCIIVKDLSRFGRNHIETGNYIEKIFPFMGVRFIAVTDHYDSMDSSCQKEAWGVNLKNLVNEMYARDIAVKVRSVRNEKWAQGSYNGGVPPYGYRAEWTGDKRCLYIEESTSDIVKQMYELFLSGKSRREIVRWLYDNRIASPREYHKTGNIYCREKEALTQWSSETVKRILTNPVYTGCLVQGWTGGKDYMLRDRQDVDSGDWPVKEHTHEPIISEELFSEAAARFEKLSAHYNKSGCSRTVPAKEDAFADILFCGVCGEKLKRTVSIKRPGSRDRVKTYRYYCPRTGRMDKQKCNAKSITLEALEHIVKGAVRQEFALSAMRPKELVVQNKREAEQRKAEWNRQFLMIEKNRRNIRKRVSELYMQYRKGELDEEQFVKRKEEQSKKAATLQRKAASIEEQLNAIDFQTNQNNHFLRSLVKGNEKTELTVEAVHTLIERIELYPDYRIKVVFAFKRSEILPEWRPS